MAHRFFRVMVPVNLRPPGDGSIGNMVSMLPVTLPLDIGDPVERFAHIHTQTLAMKASRLAELMHSAIGWLGLLPAASQALTAGLLDWFSTTAPPLIHTISTNVPGPQVPLYTCGRRMLKCYPHVPTGLNIGISLAVSSYDQRLFFALTSDAQAAPDASRMKEFLEATFLELREAAGVAETPPHKIRPRPARRRRPNCPGPDLVGGF